MKRIKELILILVITVSLFVLTEIGLRIWSYFSGRAVFSSLTIDDPALDWKLMPDYRRKSSDISINSQGFRGHEFFMAKGSLIRIISIGDSCTFGDGSSRYEFTYPRLLGKKLDSLYGANVYQVINAGVPGYTSNQCRLYFKNELLKLDPDIVILYCGWNDIWTYKNPHSNTAASPTLRSLSRVASKSLTFTLFRNYVIRLLQRSFYATIDNPKKEHKINPKLKEQALNSYKENMLDMINIAKARNIKIYLLTMPTVIRRSMPDTVKRRFIIPATWVEGYNGLLDMQVGINRIIRGFRDIPGVKVIDADDVMENFSDQQITGLFSDAKHPNDRGYEIIADIVSQNLITGKAG